MLDAAAPDHPNAAPRLDPGIALQLPADAYYHLVRTLRLALPPALTEPRRTPGPDDLARRDHAAIARIAALVPANAAEAELAAQFVAASEQSKDCLRLVNDPETSAEWAHKCRAQATSMMRQANSALRLLLRLQAAREKRDADRVTCDRAAWTEHCAMRLMTEALSQQTSAPVDAPPPPQAKPQPEPEPTSKTKAEPVGEPEPDRANSGGVAAEQYVNMPSERAALTRRSGRLGETASFATPDKHLARPPIPLAS